MMSTSPHLLKSRLQQIHDSIPYFKPLIERPPILDSSLDATNDSNEENQWLKQENIPGLKKLKDNINIDLGALDKFLDDPDYANLPPLSTNAPYLIAVWNEVLCAPAPIVSVFKTFLINTSTSASDGSRKKVTQSPPGAKVDVVADNGRRWIRVNTAKNSRLLSEFREIDSYLTDSDYESDDEDTDNAGRPSLAQTYFDNSILRMGRSLLDAAKVNPIEGTTEIPKVTLRLTRLDPNLMNEDGTEPDIRIAQTLSSLREMGIDVELGERTESELPTLPNPITNRPSSPSLPFIPTININLDLSILIAFISDLTHTPLPTSLEEANKRFLPPQEYREWKRQKKVENSKSIKSKSTSHVAEPSGIVEADINDLPNDLIVHSRALTNQLLQEMGKGLLQEIHDRIRSASNTKEHDSTELKVTFWTTPEARDRCLRIISKIGGVQEKRRAHALFCYDPAGGGAKIPLDEATRLYWQDSRFEPNFIPLLPIHFFPTNSVPTSGQEDKSTLIPGSSSQETPIPNAKLSSFSKSLEKVCADILSQETIAHRRALPDEVVIGPSSEIQRAIVTKANPRLTAHTVQSMHWGAHLGWTTLTANRTSVKAILKEMKIARISGRLTGVDSVQLERPSGSLHVLGGGGGGDSEGCENGTTREEGGCWAAMWIVDPRSLAEGFFGGTLYHTLE